MKSLVPCLAQRPDQCAGELRVEDEAHSGDFQYNMVYLPGGILKARANVVPLKKFVILQDLLLRHTGAQHIEHVLDSQAIMTDARLSAALLRIEGYSLQMAHAGSLILHWIKRNPPPGTRA